jgi:hypothetical protein
VHFGLVLGIGMIVLVFSFMRPALGVEQMDELTTVFRLVAIALLFVTVLAMRLTRSRIEPIRSRDERDAWWQANLPKVIVVWALADGAAMVGAVFWLLTGDYVILAVVTGVALALLLMHRPALMEM